MYGMNSIRGAAKHLALLISATLLATPLLSDGPQQGRRLSRQVDDPRAEVRLLEPRSSPVEPADRVMLDVVAGTALEDAIAWLASAQNPSGSWGSVFEFEDTTTAVEALGRAQPTGPSFESGVAWLTGQLAADNDELSRQISALLLADGLDIENLIDDLLASRNAAATNPTRPNYPEGGWGLATRFETDSLTTALALLALAGTDRRGGFGLVDETLAAAGTNVHEWEIPLSATEVRIRITVSGSEVLLRMTEGAPPTVGDPYVTLSAGETHEVVFPDTLPFTPGTNFISVESPDPPALAATYSLTASYQTPDVDTRAFAEALYYLRLAQNGDGGWGIQVGDSTSFYTTLHVLLALIEWQEYDFAEELDDGIDYLLTQQLGDGSFGYSGIPISYMTALGALALVRADGCPFSTETENAIGALLGQQESDGSWAQEPFDTGLALRALWEYDNDGDGIFADGDCSGTAGDNPCPEGVTINCDDNCVAYANPAQATVTFGQDIIASEGDRSFHWSEPMDIRFVAVDPSDLSGYSVLSSGEASHATSLYVGGNVPTLEQGFYYLVRRAGDCAVGSWQSSPGAEPGRDAVLP